MCRHIKNKAYIFQNGQENKEGYQETKSNGKLDSFLSHTCDSVYK